MKIKLAQVTASGEELVLQESEITVQRILIGRKPKDEAKVAKEDGVENIFIDNATVSSRHCEVVFEAGGKLVLNDSSRNGTTLLYGGEERLVKGEQFSCDGQAVGLIIKAKDVDYRLEIGAVESGKEKASKKSKKEEKKPQKEDPDATPVEPQAPKPKREKAPKKTEKAEKVEKKEKEAEKPPRKKKNLDVPKEAKQKAAKKQKEPKENDEASASVHEDNFKEFDVSDNENSDSSVVQGMVVPDDALDESSATVVDENDLVDRPAEEIDFSPELFLKANVEQASLQQLEEDKKIDDEDFKKQYPGVIIPKPQLEEDLDLYLQIRHFDLYEAPIWVSDITPKQQEILDLFNPKVSHDLNPEKIKYYICAKPKRTARFLLALAAGIPIIDGRTLEIPSVIAKTKKMEYRYLECQLLNPSVKDLVEPYEDTDLKALIEKFYTNYNLAFVTSQLQQHRLLCPYGYLLVSDFTLKYNVQTPDHVETLINYCLFLTQLGAKVILALDSEIDSVLRGSSDLKKLLQCKQFKIGITRALIGDTAPERAAAYIQQLRTQDPLATVVQVVADGRAAFEIEGCDIVQKEDFARSALLGFWVEAGSEQ